MDDIDKRTCVLPDGFGFRTNETVETLVHGDYFLIEALIYQIRAQDQTSLGIFR